jgi:hypothetical protein
MSSFPFVNREKIVIFLGKPRPKRNQVRDASYVELEQTIFSLLQKLLKLSFSIKKCTVHNAHIGLIDLAGNHALKIKYAA